MKNNTKNMTPTRHTMTTQKTTKEHLKELRLEEEKEIRPEDQYLKSTAHLSDRDFLRMEAVRGYELENPEDI
jgi:hypothetical protein